MAAAVVVVWEKSGIVVWIVRLVIMGDGLRRRRRVVVDCL
jgi:hypothetical protein